MRFRSVLVGAAVGEVCVRGGRQARVKGTACFVPSKTSALPWHIHIGYT